MKYTIAIHRTEEGIRVSVAALPGTAGNHFVIDLRGMR